MKDITQPSAGEIGVITSDVPLPLKDRRGPRNPRKISDLLRALKPGESLLLPRNEQGGIHSRARGIGIRVSTLTVSLDLIRVWRVS
jgi:hypothetical protein